MARTGVRSRTRTLATRCARDGEATVRAKSLASLEARQKKTYDETHALYEKLKDAGHILTHPYKQRAEAKGDESFFRPDMLTL